MFGKKHSAETIRKIRTTLKGRKKPERVGRPSQKISVFDNDNNETTTYDSMREAARALYIRWEAIKNYLTNNK
jgi:hypothetical protein